MQLAYQDQGLGRGTCKASLMVHEFKKYRINIAGISETKWFGQIIMYEIEGYTILHSGHPVHGCTLAPTLFNLYLSAVVASWRGGCAEAGVDVLFYLGGS